MTPVTKFWVCKLAPWLIGEAMECLGGNGYVEELPLARLYREAPVNAIWEGSGNVMALDVLRVVQREPDTARTVLDEIANGASNAPAVLKGLSRISDLLVETHTLEVNARTLCETLAMTAAAALLQRHAPPAVADAFLATRLGGMPRLTYGQGLADWDRRAILARTAPYLS
jgi:putative acyl-CoA dehydrogenase